MVAALAFCLPAALALTVTPVMAAGHKSKHHTSVHKISAHKSHKKSAAPIAS
jgi:hypothetical protein